MRALIANAVRWLAAVVIRSAAPAAVDSALAPVVARDHVMVTVKEPVPTDGVMVKVEDGIAQE